MQIHEITRPMTEGILSTIGQDIKSAVGGAVDKVGAVLNTPGALTTGRGYGAALDKAERAQADRTLQQQTQQQAKKYTQEWVNHMKASGVDPAAPTTRAEPGQMPATVAASKAGQDLQKMFGQPRGGIQDMKSDLEEAPLGNLGQRVAARAARAAKRNPGVAPATAQVDPYQEAFVRWSDSQLTGRVSGTREQLTMDDVRKDAAEKTKLDAILARIAQDPSDARAVEEYFTTAMQAMQKVSAEKRASSGVRGGATAATGDEILPRYIPPRQLEELKQLLVNNPMVVPQIKKELGIR